MTRSSPTVPVSSLTCSCDAAPSRWLAIVLALGLPGCAMSAIVDSDDAGFVDDGGFEESQGSASDPDDDTAQDEDDDDAPGPSTGNGATRDAAKPSSADDAGAAGPVAAEKDAAVRDAAVRDAGRIDSGAGSTVPPGGSTPADAGRPKPTIPDGRMCRAASDCTQSCVPIGILTCCRDNGTCGCTWAPGAYCL